MDRIKLLIVAGEASGDVHAANIVRELKKTCELEISGSGGPRLAAEGQRQLCTVQEMAAIGFDQAIRKIPMLLRLAKSFEREIAANKPDLILTVDYTGFNLRLGKRLHKYGIPIVQFVSPQFWIWHYSRVKSLRKYFSKVLCILPFEEEMLKKEGVNGVYIGNPVTDGLHFKYINKDDFYTAHNLDPAKLTIGLVPGSRRNEIKLLMPVIIEAAKRVNISEVQFVLARADSVPEETLLSHIPEGLKVDILVGETHDIMKYSDILWICSGTATLEAAVIGTAMIILYKSSAFNVFIIKLLTSLRMIGMPNIISGRYVVPEVIGRDCTPENLVKKHYEMLPVLDGYRRDLAHISEMFAGRTPIKTAADEILKSINTATEQINE